MYAFIWHFVKIFVMYLSSEYVHLYLRILSRWNRRYILKPHSINQFNYYTPPQRIRGLYWFHPVRLSYVCVFVLLSVRPSVSLSVSVCPPSVDMILSTHVLRNRCMDFSEFVHWLLTICKCAPRIFILNGQFFFIL